MKANQRKQIWDFMQEHGSITPMEAFNELYITKLATRISEMIRDGYEIEKVMEYRITDSGVTKHYMRYYPKAV